MLLRTTTSLPKNLHSIQALRAIAALLVTLFHLYNKMGHVNIAPSFLQYFKAGFGGVDLFFVISGFIITHTNRTKLGQPHQLISYLKKRFIRIYAIYWPIFLLASIGLLGLNTFAPSLQWLTYSFEPATVLQAIFLVPNHESILPVTWTLSHELYFYILFGLVIMSRFLLVVPLSALAATLLYGLANWAGVGYLPTFPLHDFLLNPFNLEFCFGVAAYLLIQRYQINMPPVLTVIALLFFFLMGSLIDPSDIWSRIWGLGLPATVILLGLVKLELADRFEYPAWLLQLGDASYLLYLIHIPVIMVATHLLLIQNLSELVIVTNVILIGMMGWLSCLMHRWAEKPLLNWIYAHRYRIFGFSYRTAILDLLRISMVRNS